MVEVKMETEEELMTRHSFAVCIGYVKVRRMTVDAEQGLRLQGCGEVDVARKEESSWARVHESAAFDVGDMMDSFEREEVDGACVDKDTIVVRTDEDTEV
jgi:hypothetical protein